jgi:hypothetical protein
MIVRIFCGDRTIQQHILHNGKDGTFRGRITFTKEPLKNKYLRFKIFYQKMSNKIYCRSNTDGQRRVSTAGWQKTLGDIITGSLS